MPKIGTYSARIENDQTKELVEYTVYYTTQHGFYAVIPAAYNESFDLLTEEDKGKLSAKELRRGKYQSGEMIGRAATGPTEKDAQARFVALIEHLISAAIKARDVIVLWHTSHKDSYSKKTVTRFPEVGTSFEFMYCTEQRVGNGKPRYYVYTPNHMKGYPVIKESIDVDKGRRHTVTVIDDTKANREALESLYAALDTLDKKLKEITATSAALEKFIGSKQTLLVNKA